MPRRRRRLRLRRKIAFEVVVLRNGSTQRVGGFAMMRERRVSVPWEPSQARLPPLRRGRRGHRYLRSLACDAPAVVDPRPSTGLSPAASVDRSRTSGIWQTLGWGACPR